MWSEFGPVQSFFLCQDVELIRRFDYDVQKAIEKENKALEVFKIKIGQLSCVVDM